MRTDSNKKRAYSWLSRVKMPPQNGVPPAQPVAVPAPIAQPVPVGPIKAIHLIPQYDDAGEQQLWEAFISVPEELRKRSAIRSVLIHRYYDDAMKLAYSFCKRRMPAYSLTNIDDLKSQASIGLIQAVDRYQPACGVKFAVYARDRINGSMIDGLRTMQDYPRMIARNRREMRPKIEELRHQLGYEPTIDDICKRYGEDLRGILEDPLFKTGVFNQYEVSSDNSEGGPTESLERMPDHRKPPRDISEMIDGETVILSFFDEIKRPDLKTIVYGYYFLGVINKLLARSQKTSISTIGNRRNEAIKLLRKRFSKEELRAIFYDE